MKASSPLRLHFDRAWRARIVALLVALCPLLGALPTSSQAEPFVFVSLPDTQIYADNRTPDGRLPAVTDERGTGAIFYDQTRWIVDNRSKRGIRYVGHLGDIVQHGDDLEEWALAKDAMDLLRQADIPHGTVMGNHDDNHGPDYRSNYLAYFGPSFFEDRPWYRASSPAGAANLQLLEHEGVKIGFLNISIDHPQAELDWASGVVQDNPDTIFILGTHRYLYDVKITGGRYGEDVLTPLGIINLPQDPIAAVVEPNSAEEIFQKFVSQHPNVLMIHAGHFHSEWLRLDGLNGAGRTVLQILTDYQCSRNGGDGWLRLYEMDFDAGTFSFETYSPTLDRMRTVMDHFVETIFLAYDQRQQIMDLLDISESTYFLLLGAIFKDTPAPDGFLLQHPDFDTEEERAYYEKLLNEMFLGDPPEGFDDIVEWEGMWLIAFAANPGDPFDFSESVRSPSGSIGVDFYDYFTPSPAQLLARAFDEILMGLSALSPEDLRRSSARTGSWTRCEPRATMRRTAAPARPSGSSSTRSCAGWTAASRAASPTPGSEPTGSSIVPPRSRWRPT